MLWFFIGIVFGGAVTGVAVFCLQCLIIRQVAPALGYRFDKYVFCDTQFPKSDFEQGRVIRRCLYPARVHIRYFDVDYNEVTEAKKPGRYGALVKISLNGGVTRYCYVTLYRTPEKVFWWNGPMSIVAKLPPGTGINPTVLEKQEKQIGDHIRNGYAGQGEISQHLSILLAGLSETPPEAPPAVDRLNALSRNSNWWWELRKRLGLTQKYPYLTDLPPGYDEDPHKKWPLILYLHGGNQNGKNLDIVRQSGLAVVTGGGRKGDAVVISPQAPWFEDWNVEILIGLIDEACATYRIDPDRICVTGISSGAVGTWRLALAYPDRISAIFPVGGDNDPRDVANLTKLHIWAFTGLLDDVMPASNLIHMIDEIRKAGGKAHLTIYPDRFHDTEYVAYETDDLYTWLFAQKRGQPEVETPGLPKT